MGRQAKTEVDRPEWPARGQPHRMAIARTTVSYWREKIFKPVGRGGVFSPHFSVRIGHQRRRERFPLYSPNKEASASKAAQIFSYLLYNGWEATLEKYKPQAAGQAEQEEEPSLSNTVGALIAANQKYSSARPHSLQAYIRAFRRIASGVMEYETKDSFLPRRKCGNDVWRKQVDALPLHELTPTRIQSWKQRFLRTNGKTATAKRRAATTVNSLVRNGKALLSKKVLPFLYQELELPSPLPFEGVTMEKPPSLRYRSKIDAKVILQKAHEDLKQQNVEAYKIFLLALVCGLRVSEIDYLLWEAFDFNRRILTIEDTEYHQLKSEDSTGEIALSDDLKSIFQKSHKLASDIFVIESSGAVARSELHRSYRCKGHIETLKQWLRDNGVTALKPIHELRKEVGSILASEEGIFAASRYLRHSDIRITSAFYADQKNRVVPSIGEKLLG